MIAFRILLVFAGLFFGVAAIGALSDQGRGSEHMAAFYCFVLAMPSLYLAYVGPRA